MKKTLLSILAGVAVIGSASAVPSVGDRKEMCEKKDGWVWVECSNACVPINTCLSNDKQIRRSYCDRFFEYSRLREDFLEAAINPLLDMNADTSIREYNIVDDNFVAVKKNDGCYQVFEFANIDPQTGKDGASAAELFKIAKMLYGFGDRDEAVNSILVEPCKRAFVVKPIMEKDCNKLVGFYRDFAKTRIESMEFTYDENSGECKILVDVPSDQCIYD